MAKKAPKQTVHKYFEDQFDDEEVLYVFRRHPVVMRKGLILWSFALLVGPLYVLVLTKIYENNPDKLPTVNTFYLAMLGSLILSIMVFFPFWLSWYFSVFIVTTQRFIQITQKGFFHRSVSDMGLSQILSVNYEIAGLQETMLGFGTIKVQTFMGDVLLREVHHPAHTAKKIIGIMRAEGVTPATYPRTTAVPEDEDEDEEA